MSIHGEISARIQKFVSELEVLVRQAAIEAVTTSLGGDTAPKAAALRIVSVAPSAPPSASAAKPTAAKPTTGKPTTGKHRKGAKRTPEQLAKIDAAILAHVKANSGQGVEQMAKGMNMPSHDLKPRVALLVDSKQLKKTGVKRATKYFAR